MTTSGEFDVPPGDEPAGAVEAAGVIGAVGTVGAADELPAAYPPVAAVVVTRNPGPWLDDALDGLAGQDYPDLAVLVVDCGSEEDPTPRVASILPGAFVRRIDRAAGFAAAANEALAAVQGATFLLLFHDDVVLEYDAVRILVEEAYRSNAGIVGPKLVSADDPEVLLEVGRAIDRFGAPYTGIEPGELDQEQHDGVRDVFYVTTATMLVRVDLFTELHGFDPATFPGSEDLDLCWRARLAGARVLVAPDARVAHRGAAEERTRADRPDELALARPRVRVLFTSYSFLTLLWLVPFGIVVGVLEAVGNLVTGHPRRARAAIGAWVSNLVHFRSWRASRRRAQGIRHVHDRDLRELQVGSTARLGVFFSHHVQHDERFRTLGDRGRSAVGSVSDGLRTPAALAFLAFLALVVVGSRGLVSGGVPSIGTPVPWPSVGDLFDSFTSAWRYTGLGSDATAPPLLAAMGGIGTVLFGAVGLARTLVVVLAMPIGAFGAYRLARRLTDLRGPAFAAGLAYGVNPVARNAIAEGRLGPLVMFALLPLLLSQLIAIARLGDAPAPRARGRGLRFAIVLAFATAWYPLTPVFVVVAVLAILVVSPFTGGSGRAVRALGVAVAGALATLVLLFPWPLAYLDVGGDRASLGLATRATLELSDTLRFHSGPAGGGWAMWGLVIAAAVPLFIATGPRLAWATRGWAVALAGWATVWVPARFWPDQAVAVPEAGLTLAALGLALALGIGVSVLVDGVQTMRFGWRQPAAIIGGIALLLPVFAFVGDAADGRWDVPATGWGDALSYTSTLDATGQFRMLWVGSPDVLPLDPVVLDDGTGYSLTRNGPGGAGELLRAPLHDADRVVGDAITLAEDGRTNRLGRLLAPAGVRFVAAPSTQGPDADARVPLTPQLRHALASQLDLARRPIAGGLVLYENLAWIPLQAVVPENDAATVPTGDVEPVPAALRTDVAGTAEPVTGAGPVLPGLVLWGEAYDSSWEDAGADGGAGHVETFGWANGFEVERRRPVDLVFGGQTLRWGLLAIGLLVWIVVAVWWWRTRVRRTPGARLPRQHRERRERPDPLAEVLSEDAFWWERV